MMKLSPGLEIWAKIEDDIKAAVVVKVAPLQVQLVNAEVPEETKPSKWFPRVPDTRVPDCCNLIHLDEANILRNLEARYETGDIYTLVSNVLISVNPYEPVPRLYTKEVRESYLKITSLNRPPHPFALASLAYHRMLLDAKSQAILISGESGAGKTENAKFVMGFLDALAQTENSISKNLQAKMVEYINPVLESFGNATTVRNDNSSRFGKFNSLVFDKDGSLCGSKVETFLLESNRVVHYGAKERTYHVFYEMFFHPDAARSFFLDSKKKYRVLGTLKRETPPRDDSKNFQALTTALVKTGFKKEESLEIFRILAALIHFGEIEFQENEEEIAYIVDQKPLKRAAELLGFEEDRCRDVLLSKQIIVKRAKRESIYRLPFRMDKAKTTLSSLMKTIYKRLFDYIVKRLNDGAPATSNFVVRILDIYGFEQLEANSLEQLCINLANEELHKYFIVNCMEFEQKAYEMEELKWTHVALPNNGIVVDIIRNIFAKMDEHGKLLAKNQKTTDERLTQDIIKNNFGKNDATSLLTQPRRKNARSDIAMGFVLKHYAGTVTYETASWLEKNNSRMSMEQESILQSSARRIVKTFADVEDSDAPNISVCTKYSTDLTDLLNTVKDSNVHYIRCLKPNEDQKPKQFNRPVVLAQMMQSGTVELVNVMHHGWPCRCEFKQLSDRFQPMLPPEYFALMDARTFTEALMVAFGVPKTEFCLGKTKLFMKSGRMSVIDQLKDQEIVLSTVMRYIRRKKISRCMHAIKFLVWYRKYIRRRRLEKLLAAWHRSAVNYVRLRRWLYRARRRIHHRNVDAGCRKLQLTCCVARGMKRWLIKAQRSLRRKEIERLLHVWFRACNFQIHLQRWARSVIRRRRSRHNALVFAIVLLSIQLQRARKRIRDRKCKQHLHIMARNVFLGIRLRRLQRTRFPRLQVAHAHRCATLCKTYFGKWRRQVGATQTLHQLTQSHDRTAIANGFSSWHSAQRKMRVASLWTTLWRFVLLRIYLREWLKRRRMDRKRKIEWGTAESRQSKMEQRFQEQQHVLDQDYSEVTPKCAAQSSYPSATCRSDISDQYLKRPLKYTSPLTSPLISTPQKMGRMMMFASPSTDTEVNVFVQEPTDEFPLQVNLEDHDKVDISFPSLEYSSNAGKTIRAMNHGGTTTKLREADHDAEEDEDLERAFRTACMVVLFTNYVLSIVYLKRWVKRWRGNRQREAWSAKRPKINVDSTPNSTRPRSSTPVLQTQRRKEGKKITPGSQMLTPQALSSVSLTSPPSGLTPRSRLRAPLSIKCFSSESAHSASLPPVFPAPSKLASLLAPSDLSKSASPTVPISPLTPQSMLRAPMVRRPFQSPSSTRLVTSRDFPNFSAGARKTRNTYSHPTNTASKHCISSMSNMPQTPQDGKTGLQVAMPYDRTRPTSQTTRHIPPFGRAHCSDVYRTENQLNIENMSLSPVPRTMPSSAPPKRQPSHSPPAKRLRTSWAQLTSGLSWAAQKLFGLGGSLTVDPLATTLDEASHAPTTTILPSKEEESASRDARSPNRRIALNERREGSHATRALRASPLPLLSSPVSGRTNLHASPRPPTAKRRVSLLRFSSVSDKPSLLSFDSTGETPRSEPHCAPTTGSTFVFRNHSPPHRRQCSTQSELSEGKVTPIIDTNTSSAAHNASPCESHQPSIPLAIFSPMSTAPAVKDNEDHIKRKKVFSRHLNAYMEHVNRNQSRFKSNIRKPGWTATK